MKISIDDSKNVHPFPSDYVLAGTVWAESLNFRFEAWAQTSPLPEGHLERKYEAWRRASRNNRPKRNVTVRVLLVGYGKQDFGC